MIKQTIALTLTAVLSAQAQLPPAATNSPGGPKTISIQEMLLIGPPQLKMHSLAMLSQGNNKEPLDESYLPGLKACTEDASAPIRSIAARLIGEHFVADREQPNPEAVELLITLSKDKSADVRYSAVYHGLSQIKTKTPEILELLIDTATESLQDSLKDQISASLANYRPQVTEILNRKLKEDNAIAYFEIYEDFTGQQPVNADKYLDMPSSRTRLFIFSASGDNPDAARAELVKELKAVGIQNPSVQISGTGNNYVLAVKTYITKEGMAVDKNFSGEGKFRITQQMWLSPELEIQLEAINKAQGRDKRD